MKVSIPLLFIILFVTGCATLASTDSTTQHTSCYTPLSKKDIAELRKHFRIDTLIVQDTHVGYVANAPIDGRRYCMIPDNVILEKWNGGQTQYYALARNATLLSDSTIIQYTLLLPSDTFSNSFEDGMWFYVRFNKKKITYEANQKPAGASKKPSVNGTGIYRYEADSLYKVSAQQNDVAFRKVAKEGFYYLPPPGRLFNIYPISEIR
ncbi:hypothetical protein [Chitinophaga pinensis]|uniref:Lipoprotein n=1 Tax=Chitinophaga pinensis (strain ATCC 43595 / DSM 2588 / LMG 13176 / NBRC 15968 / NCIMB 11800 / UQM 2034) TaxID=485918 RepID=A0A979G0T3_CHIPD|nr:hypothetical protein [Chitinophaga pinensis]ACU58606.1 hypothetical protein Cpin_1108 [Chitinophaga pinensis DSM 2588]